MAFQSTADFEDEEFGFHCKRIIRPPLSSLTNPIGNGYEDPQDIRTNSKMNHKKINDEYDEKPAPTRISKEKGVAFEKKLHWKTPEHSNTLALSPISPFTPPDNQQYQQKQQQQSRSYIDVNTLSPELTGPQTALSPYKSTTTTSNAHDTNMPTNTVISDDSITGKVKVPPSSVPTSEYYKMIDPDLPQEEKIRQLVLMLLQQNLDRQFSVLNIVGDDDEAIQAEVTRKTNVQWVWQQVIQKLSNRETNPFGSRPGKESVYIYATPNPENERHLKKLQSYKQLYSALKKESADRERARFDVFQYSANAEDLRETLYAGDTINLGSCHDYIHLMNGDQQDFIAKHQQWKDGIKKRLCNNDGGDNNNDTTSTSIPTLRELLVRKGVMVSELRTQLFRANQRQIHAGQVGDQLLEDIKARLKRKTLIFPTIDKPMKAIDDTSPQTDQPSSSSAAASSSPSPSSSSHTDTTNTENQAAQQMKKRRLVRLQGDIEMEMYGKPNFELFRNMTKYK